MACLVFTDRACPAVVSLQQAKQAWVSGSGLPNGRPVCAHTPTVAASWLPAQAQQGQANRPTQAKGGPPEVFPGGPVAATRYSVTLTCPIDGISLPVETAEDHRGCS